MEKLNINVEDLYEYYGLLGGNVIEYSSSGYPSTYLDFALEDLKGAEGSRCSINAVGNAKRAFHFQIESLSDAFSIKLLKKGRIGIIDRIKFLQECGVISPNILRKLNKTRNEIEHDYYIPSFDEAQDYVDIVELFLHATNMLAKTFPTSMGLELMEDEDYDKSKKLPKYLEAKIVEREGEIIISSKGFENLNISSSQDNYLEWVNAIVRQYFI